MERIRGGTRIGNWKVLRPLGRGGMGAVFLAEEEGGRLAALKVLTLQDERARCRFRREADLGRELRHPNLVQVFDTGEFAGSPYLVMEFVEGRDLAAIARNKGRLPAGQLLELARQLAAGLEVLHGRDLVHRDLKPENLMIDRAGVLRIMDLGLIRDPDATAVTKTGSLVGTPWFMAPEQVTGATATAAADLFAFALILYCLLTGRHPFRHPDERDFLAYLRRLIGTSPRPWHPRAAGGPLDAFFTRGMAREPSARHGSARELAEAFERALSDETRERPDSVEQTLEIEVEDPGVEAFDVEAEHSGVGAFEEPTPPEVSAEVPEGARRFRGLTLVIGLLLFVGAFLREGPRREEVLVASVEGLALAEGRFLLVRTDGPADLDAGGVSAGLSAEGGRLHLLAIPAAAISVEVRTRGGTTIYSRDAGEIDWMQPPAPRRSYAESGSLVLEFPRPPFGALALRTAEGATVADTSTDPAVHRFRLMEPGGTRLESLELALCFGEAELRWQGLPPEPSRAERLTKLLEILESADVIAWMLQAGRGPGAPARLRAHLAETGLIELCRLARREMERVLARQVGDEARRERLLRQLSKLAALSAYFVSAGQEDPLAYPSGSDAVPVWAQDYFQEPPELPEQGSRRFPAYTNTYALLDSPNEVPSGDPLTIMARDFGEQSLSPMEPRPGDYWLALYTNEWRAGFLSEAWVNDHGPFLVSDDPSVDRPAGWDVSRYPRGNPERRTLRVRLPGRVLEVTNRLRLTFRPWAHLEAKDVIRPFAIVEAAVLEPAR